MNFMAILTGVSIGKGVVTSANAADFGAGSLLDTPYAVVPWNWSGFYGGWIVGYGAGDSNNYVSPNANNEHGWASNNPSGVLVGGTIGYNYQWAPNWVAGAEADLSWSGMEGQQHLYIYDGHD